MTINFIKKYNFKIFIVILISVLIDNLFISNINNPPSWDQGYHLSNVFKMFNILGNSDLNINNKIDQFLNVTDSYRGPLTYFLSALFLNLTKNTYHFAYLSNQIFSIVCILTIYNLGKLFKDKSTGLWASIIFTFSSQIVNLRSDYLIDLSLTSFSSLNLLIFTKWFLEEKKISLYSIFSGISLGLIFLIKPTGIILFFLPFIIIIIKLFGRKSNFRFKIKQILLFISSFLVIIFPWFSRHWITIITSSINAWKWGINYQEGLDFNTIGSWLYYLFKLPYILGIINFSILSIIFLFEKFEEKDLLKLKIRSIKKINLWFLIYLLNCYLVVSIMSTKDIRFILPLYPLICIYISSFINSNKSKFNNFYSKKNILIISISISLLLQFNGFLISNWKNNLTKEWPHKEIIEEIEKDNKGLIQTLAILPDTKEINTFNLEAEAARKGELVAVRQIISNKESYKEDLKYFDWFLLKTGNQGIMTSESKSLLNKYLLNNSSFTIYKEWNLTKDDRIMLLRRKDLNTKMKIIKCEDKPIKLVIRPINNGFNINLSGSGEILKSSNLLLNIYEDNNVVKENISIAQGLFYKSTKNNMCYEITQNISSKNIFNEKSKLDTFLLKEDGKLISINSKIEPNQENDFNNYQQILMSNKNNDVNKLGIILKKGEFENLFNLIGILNQSDPKQIYLLNAKNIFQTRFKEDKNLKNLYNILITQILQKEIREAKITSNKIIDLDKKNGNSYLVNGIINLYLLNPNEANKSFKKAKNLRLSEDSEQIIKITDKIFKIFE